MKCVGICMHVANNVGDARSCWDGTGVAVEMHGGGWLLTPPPPTRRSLTVSDGGEEGLGISRPWHRPMSSFA